MRILEGMFLECVGDYSVNVIYFRLIVAGLQSHLQREEYIGGSL